MESRHSLQERITKVQWIILPWYTTTSKKVSLDRLPGRYPPSSCPSAHINWFGVIPKNNHQDNWCLITKSLPSLRKWCEWWHILRAVYLDLCNYLLSILQSGRNKMLANLMLNVQFAYPSASSTCWGWNGEAINTLIIAFPFCSVQQLSINGLTSLLIFWLSWCWTKYTFPTCSWKIRGHNNIVVLFGNYTGHQVHGDKATSRQDNQLLTKGRLPKKKATKKQIMSFVGTLHDATKVVHSGRGFALRMYGAHRPWMVTVFSGILWYHTRCQHSNWCFRKTGLHSSNAIYWLQW